MIIRPPKSTNVLVRSNIYVSCYAEGTPSPSYTWLINNQVIRNVDPYKKTETFFNGISQLRVFAIEPGSANYTCIANNGVGVAAIAIAKIIAISGKI